MGWKRKIKEEDINHEITCYLNTKKYKQDPSSHFLHKARLDSRLENRSYIYYVDEKVYCFRTVTFEDENPYLNKYAYCSHYFMGLRGGNLD